ncbi:hypothetical protein IC762_12220 [Bradyrhizobium genosp. L]|uniref:hypothetical protein n=1 Tax=Bradyrhizobium genosp. L TaxID=83637 RepID=UPI0018A25691|nr:hypothetical protein [Bradyrhizobium genosp. L]QPF87010.1 hypothetical protein IC762_12220 [Bradyrhizobium genosp. L]
MTVVVRTPYARKGETVTCEAGHPICDFVETVYVGEIQDVDGEIGNWRQEKVVRGTIPIPGCAICGAAFTDGIIFHIGNEWRDPLGRRDQ